MEYKGTDHYLYRHTYKSFLPSLACQEPRLMKNKWINHHLYRHTNKSLLACQEPMTCEEQMDRSGSGYIHRRSQSMAINATEQGERINCFYIGLHFYLSLPCLLKLCWVVTTIMFQIWLKTLLLSVLLGSRRCWPAQRWCKCTGRACFDDHYLYILTNLFWLVKSPLTYEEQVDRPLSIQTY